MKTKILKKKQEVINKLQAGDVHDYPLDKWFPKNSWSTERKIKFTLKKIEKYYDAELAEADAIENAEEVREFSISVEWANSRMWGANPNATIRVGYDEFISGSISGSGYDKESTAIAVAFNQSEKLRGILYKNRGKIADKYGWDYCDYSLSGGVGSECFWRIFESCGYEVKHVASGKTYDAWIVSKK